MAERGLIEERQAAWSRLWAQGGAGSFQDAADGDLPLRSHWRAWFAQLPSGAHVLDIATGNGILPRWLLEAHPDATCDAVDSAAISPSWANDRVVFHSAVAAECLPWSEARFDAITSQFGAEYGDLAAIVQQVNRVAKPGACLHFVMHHKDSHPMRLAAAEIEDAAWLLGAGWLEATRAMLEPMALLLAPGKAKTLDTDPRFLLIRKQFDALQAERSRREAGSICPDLLSEAAHQVTRLFGIAAKQGLAVAQQEWSKLRTHLSDSSTRLHDMRAHALTEGDVMQLVAALSASGWDVTGHIPVRDRGFLMGWQLTARLINPSSVLQ